jgi:putative peptide zinc metalloprotease protein
VSGRFTGALSGNQQNVRRLLGLIAALATVALLTSMVGSAAPAGAQDNSAVAVNKKDGKSVFKLAFQVKKTMDSDVDAKNSAVAYASCDGCRTVAAAIQVVLVMDDPDSISAENTAVSINSQCSECETLAVAHQIVFASGDDMKFTPEGKRRLRELKKRFKALQRRDDLTLQQIADEIAIIAGEVAEVVDTELVAKEKEEESAGDDFPFDSTTTVAESTTSSTP